jgi:hypothetical protein
MSQPPYRTPSARIRRDSCILLLLLHRIYLIQKFSSNNGMTITIHRTIILPVVLYGCESWSLTLREERTLRVFENRVPRRIFGLKRNKVMEGWRKLHNEKFHYLYSSPNIIIMIKSKRMRWAGHLA